MPPEIQVEFLKSNMRELQQQLQMAYVRIKELTEELQKSKVMQLVNLIRSFLEHRVIL